MSGASPADLPSGTVLRSAGFTLDREEGCLHRGSEEIALRPKTLAVLSYLAERSGRLVSKSELFAALWPGVVVTDDSLVQCITELRHAFADHDQRLIRTVPRRGYRFVATVSEEKRETRVSVSGSARVRALPLPPFSHVARGLMPSLGVLSVLCLLWPNATGVVGPPRVAVLPFDAVEGDALSERFAHGLTEDTVTKLAAVQGLDVTAGVSTDVYEGKAFDARQIGGELGVRYLVEGAVRCESASVCVTARLIDAGSGRLVWADSWDRRSADPLAVQTELAHEVARRTHDYTLFAGVAGGAPLNVSNGVATD